MAKLAISKDYLPAYARLPRKAQRKADEFLTKFERDSTSPAIHLEPIRALDAMLRSARIGDDYRIILRAPEKGDVFLVLWADHHDEAYRWAATKQTAVHPTTGTLQIFDPVLAHQAVEKRPTPPPQPVAAASDSEPSPLLFANRSDDDLFLAGVPRPLLPSVRTVRSDEDLDRLVPHLPPEAAEALTGLAAGLTLDEALAEVFGTDVGSGPGSTPPPPPDVADVPAALGREATQRQFRLLEGDLDLDAALKHPLDAWRIFLHPRQKRIAHARTKGPVRVMGGAGTGKTVVAMHRAAFLVNEVYRKPDDRILFTTFTTNLAEDLRAQLAKLVEPAALARIEVRNIDSWATSYLRSRGKTVRPAFEKEQQEHLRSAYEVYGDDAFSYEFYLAEWRDVVREQDLRTEEEYALAVRRHRGVPLARKDRKRLWPVFQAYREALTNASLLEPIDILRAARAELQSSGEPPRYQSVVVDETQDFSLAMLSLVRAIAGPEHPDDLFLVGDAQQRIYGRPISLSAAGIQVRGRRSQTLRLNYRTTAAICRYANRVLAGAEYDDLDDGKADTRGYVSVREGPQPVLLPQSSPSEEEQTVVRIVSELVAAGVPAVSICVMARTRDPLVDRFARALEHAGIAHALLDKEEPRAPGVRLATMHRAKGLEYAAVLLVDVSAGSLPHRTPELTSEDKMAAALALAKERSLLYVAASRARDDLYILWSGRPSSLLPPAPAPLPPEAVDEPAPVSLRVPKQVAPPTNEEIASTPLDRFELPARILGWAREAGVTTIGGLAAWAPASLLAQRNLGRTSVAQARTVVERLFGRSWEELASGSAPTGVAPTSFEGAAQQGNWDGLRGLLSEEQRAVLLEAMELPGRIRTYVDSQRMKTLGELAERSEGVLDRAPKLGRSSIRDLVASVAEHFARVEADRALVAQGLHASFRALVQGLEPIPRIVVTRRSGLGGESLTLQEIGNMLGFTRERARQLEHRECERMARRPWGDLVRERFLRVLREGVVPLGLLEADGFWHESTRVPDVIGFVADDVLGCGHVVYVDDEPCLSRWDQETLERRHAAVRTALDSAKLPCPKADLQAAFLAASEDLGSWIGPRWWADLEEQLVVQPSKQGVAMVGAVGATRGNVVLSVLRNASEPMTIDELWRAVGGRARMPEEVIYFDAGLVGLRQHFPDFETWHDRLVPKAEAVVREVAPNRQWSCAELLDELRDEEDLPEWLNSWRLAALIRSGSSLRYLGRLRVALPGSTESDDRLLVHEEVERLLRSAGEPMSRDELLSRVRERVGASEGALQQVFARPQFVRLDPRMVGLFDRDVPGGPAAAADALDQLESLLVRRGRGMSLVHAREAVAELSPDHASWDVELLASLVRSDGRFRLSQSGAVGLATWESTRVPTRLELVRSALAEAHGRVSVDAVTDRIAALYGGSPNRAALATLAVKLGAALDGDWLVQPLSNDPQLA